MVPNDSRVVQENLLTNYEFCSKLVLQGNCVYKSCYPNFNKKLYRCHCMANFRPYLDEMDAGKKMRTFTWIAKRRTTYVIFAFLLFNSYFIYVKNRIFLLAITHGFFPPEIFASKVPSLLQDLGKSCM